jgi:uncharacterized protein YfaQ (DUF2300 family)
MDPSPHSGRLVCFTVVEVEVEVAVEDPCEVRPNAKLPPPTRAKSTTPAAKILKLFISSILLDTVIFDL